MIVDASRKRMRKGISLYKKGYLIKDAETGFTGVSRPVKIAFPQECLSSLKQMYNPKKEVGGLFICTIKLGRLRVKKIIQLPNKSEDDNAYVIDPLVAQEHLDGFQKKRELIIPLTFHTHPNDKSEFFKQEGIAQFVAYHEKAAPSEEDKASVHYQTLRLYGEKFSPPDVVIIKNQNTDKLFLGVYDNMDKESIERRYLEVKKKILEKIVEVGGQVTSSVIQRMEDLFGWFFTRIVLVVGIGIILYLYLEYDIIRAIVDFIANLVVGVTFLELALNIFDLDYMELQNEKISCSQTDLEEDLVLEMPSLQDSIKDQQQ